MAKAIEDWRLFTRRMKRAFPTVSFLRVPERHKSGAVHFHAVMFGLPSAMPCKMQKMRGRYIHACHPKKYCERKSRALAGVWAKGFVDLQETRIPEAIGAYVAKYLTKGEPDWSLFGNHVASCNSNMYAEIRAAKHAGVYWEFSSSKSPVAVDIAMEDMLARSELVRSSTFPTRWLGDCRFEVFRLSG